jgi:anion-transporting  ArsA/GET3 family ATPase
VDPQHFFAVSRLLIVAGKGGVGKTTVTAAAAIAAARQGRRVLVVELDEGGRLGPLLGASRPLGYEPVTLPAAGEGSTGDGSGRVDGRLIVPGDALRDYLRDHGLGRLTNRLVRTGVIDVVATAAPGIDDILVLGKLKQLERADPDGQGYDLIVLDAPAAGHAVTFLRSARALADSVRGGPVLTQALDVLEMLTDPARCQVLLVTLAEETPVNELVETAFALEEDVGIHLGPVVVNGLYPELSLDLPAANGRRSNALRDAARFRLARQAQQREQVDRLARALPLPHLRLPFRFTAGLGPADVGELSEALVAEIRALEP